MNKPTYEELESQMDELRKHNKKLTRENRKLKEFEDSIKESENKFRSLFEQSPDGILIVDKKPIRILDFNTRMHENLGYTRKEFEKLEIWDFDVNEPTRQHVQARTESFDNIPVTEFETKYRKKNGEIIDVHVTAKHMEIGDEEVGLAIIRDITLKKTAEEELSIKEDCLNSSISAIGITDLDGNMIYVNDTCVKMWGYDKKAEILERSIFDFWEGDGIYNTIKLLQEKGGAIGEDVGRRKDGSLFDVQFAANMVKDQDGHNKYMMGSFIDITEKKKNENELEKISSFNQALLNSSPDVIYVYDLEKRTNVYSNEKIADLAGFTPAEIKEMGDRLIQILMHPDDFEIYINETIPGYLQAKDGELIENTYRMRHKDGNWLLLEFRETIFERNSEGDPIQIFGMISDITEKKNIEEKFRKLYENTPFGVIINQITKNAQGKPVDFIHTQANPAASIHLGMNLKDLIGKKATEIADEETAAKFIHLYGEVVRTGEPISFEQYFNHHDRTLYVTAFPLIDDFFITNFYDITERKKAEEALRESEEKLRLITDASADLISMFDINGILMFINSAGAEMYGYEKEQMYGMHMSAFLTEERIKEVEKLINKVRSSGKEIRGELYVKHKKGHEFPVSFSIAPLKKAGRIVGFTCSSSDLTEKKYLEEQLLRRQRMDSLGTLAGGIAHDFNNILVGIMGNLEILNYENKNFTIEQKETITEAIESSERAASLIRQFQNLTKVSVTGRIPVDVFQTVGEIFKILDETTDRLIEKVIDIKPEEYYVLANPGEIHQILMNVGLNAIQAIEERGTRKGDFIRIYAEKYDTELDENSVLEKGNYIHIQFEDSGIGIPEENIGKIFDPMFSTKEIGTRKGQGLGLAMVYNIVSILNSGLITVDSTPGKGTVFHIYLPEAEPPEETGVSEKPEIRGGSETILIIDDEEMIINTFKRLLRDFEYSVITATDGLKGLDIFKKSYKSIDAVILDLVMPKMSGHEVFEKMLKIDPNVKVIISSGHSNNIARKGILNKADAFMSKPYRRKEVVTLLRKVLDS